MFNWSNKTHHVIIIAPPTDERTNNKHCACFSCWGSSLSLSPSLTSLSSFADSQTLCAASHYYVHYRVLITSSLFPRAAVSSRRSSRHVYCLSVLDASIDRPQTLENSCTRPSRSLHVFLYSFYISARPCRAGQSNSTFNLLRDNQYRSGPNEYLMQLRRVIGMSRVRRSGRARDKMTQRAEIVFFLCLQEWNDLLLKWAPDEFGGVDTVRVPPSKIWTPDIVLYN